MTTQDRVNGGRPGDVAAIIDAAKRGHMDLHESVRSALIGRRVTVKPAVNGIKGRSGVIADTILTYDVSVGVDLDRLDGRPGYLDRLWFNPRAVLFEPEAA
jgi:hypothetical protein